MPGVIEMSDEFFYWYVPDMGGPIEKEERKNVLFVGICRFKALSCRVS